MRRVMDFLRSALVLLLLWLAGPAAGQEQAAPLRLAPQDQALQRARLLLRLRENLEVQGVEEAARARVARLLALGTDAAGPEETAAAPLRPHERLRLEAELAERDGRVLALSAQRTLLLLEAGLAVDPARLQLPGDPPEPWLGDLSLDERALLRRAHDDVQREQVRVQVREHALLQVHLDGLQARVLPAHEAALQAALAGLLQGEGTVEDVLDAQAALTAVQREAVGLRVRRELAVHALAVLLGCRPEEVVAVRAAPVRAAGGVPVARAPR